MGKRKQLFVVELKKSEKELLFCDGISQNDFYYQKLI